MANTSKIGHVEVVDGVVTHTLAVPHDVVITLLNPGGITPFAKADANAGAESEEEDDPEEEYETDVGDGDISGAGHIVHHLVIGTGKAKPTCVAVQTGGGQGGCAAAAVAAAAAAAAAASASAASSSSSSTSACTGRRSRCGSSGLSNEDDSEAAVPSPKRVRFAWGWGPGGGPGEDGEAPEGEGEGEEQQDVGGDESEESLDEDDIPAWEGPKWQGPSWERPKGADEDEESEYEYEDGDELDEVDEEEDIEDLDLDQDDGAEQHKSLSAMASPPSPSTRNESIQPSPPPDQPPVAFLTRSQTLMRASPVLHAALSGPWSESRPSSSSGVQTLTTENWDPDAFLIVLKFLHNLDDTLPRTFPLEMMAKIAVIVDYYHLEDTFAPLAKIWINHVRNKLKHARGRDLVLWVFVTGVFRDDAYELMTRLAVERWPGNMPSLDLPIPEKVMTELHELRLWSLNSLSRVVYDLKYVLLEDKTGCSDPCRSLLLGSTMRYLYKTNLESCQHTSSRSIVHLARLLRGLWSALLQKRKKETKQPEEPTADRESRDPLGGNQVEMATDAETAAASAAGQAHDASHGAPTELSPLSNARLTTRSADATTSGSGAERTESVAEQEPSSYSSTEPASEAASAPVVNNPESASDSRGKSADATATAITAAVAPTSSSQTGRSSIKPMAGCRRACGMSAANKASVSPCAISILRWLDKRLNEALGETRGIGLPAKITWGKTLKDLEEEYAANREGAAPDGDADEDMEDGAPVFDDDDGMEEMDSNIGDEGAVGYMDDVDANMSEYDEDDEYDDDDDDDDDDEDEDEDVEVSGASGAGIPVDAKLPRA